MIVIMAIYALFMVAGGMRALQTGDFSAFHYLLIVVYVVVALGVFLPSISVLVRRFHDRNMSGWWVLGFMLLSAVPFVGILVSIGMLVLLCLKGTDGENKYGDDPLNPSSGADVFS
jgi:uncharacterized membrane protein YhaH (DUF805 family)